MKKFGPLSRALTVAGLVVAGGLVGPAYAAQADVDLLKSYVGNYKGRGTFEGANSETVVCRLALSQGNSDKVNYSGRCAVAGTNLSINGTLAYINNRYEAAMTSNAGFSGTAIGKRSGNGVLFELQDKGKDESGKEMQLSADIALQGGAISVRFNVTTADGTYRATVPFTH